MSDARLRFATGAEWKLRLIIRITRLVALLLGARRVEDKPDA
jgi:hypothetical protein